MTRSSCCTRAALAFHGPPEQLTHYFSVHDTEEVYPRLATQPSERWQASWQKHRASYQKMLDRNRDALIASGGLQAPPPASRRRPRRPPPAAPAPAPESATAPAKIPPRSPRAHRSPRARLRSLRLPGFFSQFATLLSRRWRIFFRDRGQVFLQLAILLCFPILVTLFSDKASGQHPPLFRHPSRPTYSPKSRNNKASARTRPRSAPPFRASSCSRSCCCR